MTAEQLKAIRKRLALTQEELGERIGVTHSTISKWESGKHPINPTSAKLLGMVGKEKVNDVHR